MKNLFKFLGLIVAVTLLFSCSKQEAQHQELKALSVKPDVNTIKASVKKPYPYVDSKNKKSYGRGKGNLQQTYP